MLQELDGVNSSGLPSARQPQQPHAAPEHDSDTSSQQQRWLQGEQPHVDGDGAGGQAGPGKGNGMDLGDQARHPQAQTLKAPASTSDSNSDNSSGRRFCAHKAAWRQAQAAGKGSAAWSGVQQRQAHGTPQRHAGVTDGVNAHTAGVAEPRIDSEMSLHMQQQQERHAATIVEQHACACDGHAASAGAHPAAYDVVYGDGLQKTPHAQAPMSEAAKAAGETTEPRLPHVGGTLSGGSRGAPMHAPVFRPLSERALMRAITNVSGWSEIAELLHAHRSEINGMHISAMFTQLERMRDPSRRHVHTRKSSAAGGLRRGQLLPAPATARQAAQGSRGDSSGMECDADGSPMSAAASRKFPTAGHLARGLVKATERCAAGMRLRELSAVLASVARLGVPIDKPTSIRLLTAAYHAMPRIAGSGGGTRKRGAAPAPCVDSTTPHALAQLIWAVPRLGMRALRPDWAGRYLAAASACAASFTPQGAALVLHSLAQLQCVPPPELRDALLAVLVDAAEAGRVAPPDVSMTLWALARLRCAPPPGVGERLLAATVPQLPSFSGQVRVFVCEYVCMCVCVSVLMYALKPAQRWYRGHA